MVRLGRLVRAAQDDVEQVQGQRSGADDQVHRNGAGQLKDLFGVLVFQLNRHHRVAARLRNWCGYQVVRLRNEDRHGLQEGHFEA